MKCRKLLQFLTMYSKEAPYMVKKSFLFYHIIFTVVLIVYSIFYFFFNMRNQLKWRGNGVGSVISLVVRGIKQASAGILTCGFGLRCLPGREKEALHRGGLESQSCRPPFHFSRAPAVELGGHRQLSLPFLFIYTYRGGPGPEDGDLLLLHSPVSSYCWEGKGGECPPSWTHKEGNESCFPHVWGLGGRL